MDDRDERYSDPKAFTQILSQRHSLTDASTATDKPKQRSWWRWKAPLTIFFPLVLGLVFAIAHHHMNSYLNGKAVASISTTQSWISRFGIAFAFLVKVAFAVSAGAAYVQYQWLQLRSKSFRIDEIDSLTGILENVLRLFYNFVFLRQPVLLLMAAVAWTIPFAAVVTPGSLTVSPARNDSIVLDHVPEPLFNTSFFGNADDTVGNLAFGPLYKLAFNTAAAGQPVALPSQFDNETYSLSFFGPAVKCAPANQSLTRNASLAFYYGPALYMYEFVSWVTSVMGRPTKDSGSYSATLDSVSSDAARIFVMSGPSGQGWNKTVYAGRVNNITERARVFNVTECKLYNASYDVGFAFSYPEQTRQVSISNWLNPVPPIHDAFSYYPMSFETPEHSAQSAYLQLMQAYGKLLVGSAELDHYGMNTMYSSWEIMNIDWYRGPAVQAGLESLFQNMTLSLMSEKQSTKPKNETSPIPITYTTYPLTYVYAADELLLPYGLAFGFALLCASIGLYAFIMSEASYQNIFSSFLRATAGNDVYALLDYESHGADPLLAKLAGVRIMFGERNRGYER